MTMASTPANKTRAVLFATDLTDDTGVALSYAAAIASKYGAKLFLVHVLDPAGGSNSMELSSSDLRKLAQSANHDLQRISQSLLAAQGVSGEVLVRYGNVRDVIFQIQQECSANIVVLGSSGRKTGHGRGLGSIAESILRGMPCSVLIVGPNVERRPLFGKTPSVLFPTDFSPASFSALPTAISLTANFFGILLLLHVSDPYELHSCLGHQAQCRKKLSEIALFAKRHKLRVEQFVREGRFAESTASFAKEKDVDFIVMGVHRGDLDDGTRLHGTVSEIIKRAPCPVLTVAEQNSSHIQ